MRWDVVTWAAVALVLVAAETLAPGAFLLWLGFAAAAVWAVLFFVPMEPLWQVITFVVLAFVSVGIYVKFFRGQEKESDQPLLNRRGEQLVGQVFLLDQAIVDGRGRLKIGDAFWVAEGPDLPQGQRVRVIAARNMSLQVLPAD